MASLIRDPKFGWVRMKLEGDQIDKNLHILFIYFFIQPLHNLRRNKQMWRLQDDLPDSRTEPYIHPTCWVRKIGRVQASLSFWIYILQIGNCLCLQIIWFSVADTFDDITVVIFRLRTWCGRPEKIQHLLLRSNCT